MKNKNYITLIIILLYVISINAQKQTAKSDINTIVLEHYKRTKEIEKYKAAKFLLENMKGHLSPGGPIIDTYIKELHKIQNYQIDSINYCWDISCEKCTEEAIYKEDAMTIKADDLIENIDDAFSRWKSAPWKKEVPFEHFCKYILPYRCIDEVFAPHWRKILIEKYAPLINNCTDMKEAYFIIYNNIKAAIKATYTKCPYTIDPISIDLIKNGNCTQCSVLTVSILRALGIPAAVDMTPIWANYSRSGHLWTCLVLNNGDTYTLKNKDSIVRKDNPIDGSEFYYYQLAKDDPYPNDILMKKKASKIFRYTFENNEMHSFLQDVSNMYGMNNHITISTTDKDKTKYHLCIFLTGYNWTSIDSTLSVNKKINFKNIGSDIVYLLCKKENGKLSPINNPFILNNDGKINYFNPSSEKENITVYRKYPIISPIVIQWEKMKESVIEASNDPNFTKKDTIGILHNLPYGDYKIATKSNIKYRYVRYNTKAGTEIAEFSVFTDGNKKEIKGSPIYYNVDPSSVKYAFDNNSLTKIKTLHHNYFFGEDLGNKYNISSIKLMPKSDGNDIQMKDIYEMFYFDKKWIIAEIQKIENNHIICKLPKNAILLLKDLNNGSEERIFIYKEKKQYFY